MNGPLDIHPKVAAGSVAAAASLILIWALAQFKVALPGDVAGAIVVVLTFAAGWLAPTTKSETAPAVKSQ